MSMALWRPWQGRAENFTDVSSEHGQLNAKRLALVKEAAEEGLECVEQRHAALVEHAYSIT